MSKQVFSNNIQQSLDSFRNDPGILIDTIKLDLAQLDNYSDSIQPGELADIAGVVIGIKPAALLGSNTQKDGLLYDDIAHKLKLFYRYDIKYNTATISRYDELAGELAKIIYDTMPQSIAGQNLSDETEYKIGMLLGYPKPAIDRYIERCNIYESTGSYPEEAGAPEYGNSINAFVEFILPQDERGKSQAIAEYIVPIHDAVKNFMPRTYKKILKN